MAPILPMITDSDDQIDALLAQIAAAGATGATVFALHLRPGAREWFMRYLGSHHPELIGRVRRAVPERLLRHSLLRCRPGSPIIGAAAQARS